MYDVLTWYYRYIRALALKRPSPIAGPTQPRCHTSHLQLPIVKAPQIYC